MGSVCKVEDRGSTSAGWELLLLLWPEVIVDDVEADRRCRHAWIARGETPSGRRGRRLFMGMLVATIIRLVGFPQAIVK